MKKNILILLLCLLGWGCSEKRATDEIKTFDLTGDIYLSDDDLVEATPVGGVIIDTLLVTYNLKNDTIMEVYGINSQKRLNAFLHKGDGPSESYGIQSVQKDPVNKCIYIRDTYRKWIYKIPYSELLKNEPATEEFFMWDADASFLNKRFYNMNGTYFIAEATEKGRFIIKQGEKTEILGEFPDKELVNPQLTDVSNALLYSAWIAVSPDNTKLAACGELADMMDIFLFGKDGTVDWHYSELNAVPNDIYAMPLSDGRVQGLVTPDTKRYSVHTAATNKYIYNIWHGDIVDLKSKGMMCAKHIRVYDWDGKERYRLNIDKPIFNLIVTDDDKYLYGLTDKEGYAIYKYKLDLD